MLKEILRDSNYDFASINSKGFAMKFINNAKHKELITN